MRCYDLRTNRLNVVMCKKHAEHLYNQMFGVYYIMFQKKIQENSYVYPYARCAALYASAMIFQVGMSISDTGDWP